MKNTHENKELEKTLKEKSELAIAEFRNKFPSKSETEIINELLSQCNDKNRSMCAATGSTFFVAIVGNVECKTTNFPYFFEATGWGVGGAAVATAGILYSTINDLDYLFRETTSFQSNVGSVTAGAHYIFFYNEDGLGLGHYLGPAAGFAALICTGNGRWQKKT